MGDHMVEAYSSMGCVMVLYMVSIVSFYLPHMVEVRAFIICSDLHALVAVLLMCVLFVNIGYGVRFPGVCLWVVWCNVLQDQVVYCTLQVLE